MYDVLLYFISLKLGRVYPAEEDFSFCISSQLREIPETRTTSYMLKNLSGTKRSAGKQVVSVTQRCKLAFDFQAIKPQYHSNQALKY